MAEPVEPDRQASNLAALEEFAVRARHVAGRSRLDAVAAETLSAFELVGVDALVLKGVALARTLYRNDEHRGYLDIDLLVGPDDFETAERTLADLGYRNVVEVSGLDPFADDPHAFLWGRTTRATGPATVDLHWRLPGCKATPRVIWDAVSGRRSWIDIGGYRASILDRPGLALHLSIHAAQHGPVDQKALGDLGRGLERWPEDVWREAAQLAAEVEAVEAFAAGMRLVAAGAAMARRLALPETEALQWEIAHRHLRPRGSFHWQAFVEADDLRERLGVLRRSLLPTRRWIISEHGWAARGGLWVIAAYGLHLVCSPAWAARAWHAHRRARLRRRKA